MKEGDPDPSPEIHLAGTELRRSETPRAGARPRGPGPVLRGPGDVSPETAFQTRQDVTDTETAETALMNWTALRRGHS